MSGPTYIPPPSLPLSGSPPNMTGPIAHSLGSASLPSMTFAGHTGDGFFWDATNSAVGASAGGVQIGFLQLSSGIVQYRLIGDSTVNNQVSTYNNVASTSATFTLRKARGTQASPVLPVTGDQIGRVAGQVLTNVSGTYTNSIQMRYILTETATVDSTHIGSQYQFFACPIGSGTLAEVARLDNESGLSMFGANPVIDANRVFRNRIFTVATLPTGASGMSSFVSDALGPAFGSAVVGGGAVPVPVYHDGTSWKVG